MTDTDLHLFDTDIDIIQTKPHEFELDLSDRWSINNTPNGGYMMAMIGKAMLAFSDKKATPIITANYIARSSSGKASICLELISKTGTLTRVMARLIQNGKERIRALGTFTAEKNENTPPEYDGGPPQIAAFESAIQVPVMRQNSLFNQVDLRLDPSCTNWVFGGSSYPMEFKGWIGFKENRKMDIPSILLFADSFPPPVFVAYGAKAWVPTIELSVNIRKVPDVRVLMGRFKSRFISSGLVEEDGELWDETGDLVAISRQYSLYKK
ncbi:MAG: thioesterase family protein [Proteobacteria bacterium]|nr:thioesterase family protein [Pseudomonadota bacterium]MBU1389941.1 thioesterase family protein [Pseudomonadota bacterium]MBU1542540.1 thioesterase family protein [Pseudomonadota bacterium]MBU2479709.1 thioesterase family protein [Pseudomonadota bacterium]